MKILQPKSYLNVSNASHLPTPEEANITTFLSRIWVKDPIWPSESQKRPIHGWFPKGLYETSNKLYFGKEFNAQEVLSELFLRELIPKDELLDFKIAKAEVDERFTRNGYIFLRDRLNITNFAIMKWESCLSDPLNGKYLVCYRLRHGNSKCRYGMSHRDKYCLDKWEEQPCSLAHDYFVRVLTIDFILGNNDRWYGSKRCTSVNFFWQHFKNEDSKLVMMDNDLQKVVVSKAQSKAPLFEKWCMVDLEVLYNANANFPTLEDIQKTIELYDNNIWSKLDSSLDVKEQPLFFLGRDKYLADVPKFIYERIRRLNQIAKECGIL